MDISEELQKICQQAREMAQEKNLSRERVQAYMNLAKAADTVIMMDMIDDAIAPMLKELTLCPLK